MDELNSVTPEISLTSLFAAPRVVRLAATRRRVARLHLHVRAGPDRGAEFTLRCESTRLVRGGRSAINDVVLSDMEVSGTHFELALLPTSVMLRDLGSERGVYVGGARIKEAWLGPGAMFTAGQTVIELVSVEAADVPISSHSRFGPLFGDSLVMREVFLSLERCAQSEAPVLISGASGTGKGSVARALHERSARSRGRLVTVNCSEARHDLLEARLFGYAKGAYPWAKEGAPGCFEEASEGSVLLEGPGGLPAVMQSRLLRVLNEGQVLRAGEQAPRRARARVFAATRRDLRRLVADGLLREELYSRLATMQVALPTLKERDDDVILLAERFLQRQIDARGVMRCFSPDALAALVAHTWPGNLRELEDAIVRAYYMSEEPLISGEELGLDPWGAPDEVVPLRARVFERTLKDAREEVERIYLRRLLAGEGTQSRKARRAGLTEEGLRQALKRLGLRE
jgi:DNA-binding NtrC family response regulator